MNSSKVFKYGVRLTRLRKINSIPTGRRFSTDSHILQSYSRVAGIVGAGVIGFLAYEFSSGFKAYAYSKKRVSKHDALIYVPIV